MIKISSQNVQTTIGVDNHNNLWVWGSEFYACEDENTYAALYQDLDIETYRNSNYIRPTLVKWFKERSLKVLDVESGERTAVVKTEDKDGKIVFYALCRGESDLNAIGGPSVKSELKHYLSRIEIDGSMVQDFAMTKFAAIFTMKPETEDKN